jgi:hypothetical protein
MNDIDADNLIALLKQATDKIKELQAENEQLKEQLAQQTGNDTNSDRKLDASILSAMVYRFYELQKRADPTMKRFVIEMEAAEQFGISQKTAQRYISNEIKLKR